MPANLTWSPSAAREALKRELVAFGLAQKPTTAELELRLAIAGLVPAKSGIIPHDVCEKPNRFDLWTREHLGKVARMQLCNGVAIVELVPMREPLLVEAPTLLQRMSKLNGKTNGKPNGKK
jgi:hypothetical protein